jgi:hypothetical protein
MIEHSDITPKSITNSELRITNAGGAWRTEVPMEDYYYQQRDKIKVYLAKAKEDGTDRDEITRGLRGFVEETIEGFLDYSGKSYDKYLKYLSDEFKELKLSVINCIKKDAIAQRKDSEEGDGEDRQTSPLISRVEEWINSHYEIFFNEVNNRFTGRRIGEPEFEEIKLENLYRNLAKEHLKFAYSDLKIIMRTDFVEKRNPFKLYFEGLGEWDGIDHIGNLTKYVEVVEITHSINERDRFERMFRKMFPRMVACALEVAMNKHCFTLVHEIQSSGKSTFLRWLCPPALMSYYSENIGMSKDDRIGLAENFIINIEELSTMGKHDINETKAMISKETFKERLPYAERTEMLNRRCNFVASTNRIEFLNDETGSVRWVCFQLDRINWAYKKDIDINKVWAQAYHLAMKTNFDFQLSRDEINENEEANRAFFIRTPEMDLISKYYVSGTKEEYMKYKERDAFYQGPIVKFMTATDIKEDLTTRVGTMERLTTIQIGKAMKFIKCERTKLREGNDNVYGYFIRERDGIDKKWVKQPAF